MAQIAAATATSGRTAGYHPGPTQAVDLRAKLDRYQKQLSDCVNCASAKTPEGKADIAAISAKIDEVKRAMAESTNSSDNNAATAPVQASAPPQTSPFGNRIDTYA